MIAVFLIADGRRSPKINPPSAIGRLIYEDLSFLHSMDLPAFMTPELPISAFEVFATGVDHPECVAFARNGELWAGGEAGQIYRLTPQGSAQLVTTLGGFCAGLAFSPADELFVCNAQHGIVRIKA